VPRGTFVSYGATFETARDSRIGVIMAGYADGFRRGPRRWNYVLVRGQRAPVIGRVCMDQAMVDVTDIPEARAGDEVVLIGKQGKDALTAEEVAETAGTNNYEIVTNISARVPRVYL
jgi:alanine racemase